MPATPLIGPIEGTAVRLSVAEPGRLVIDARAPSSNGPPTWSTGVGWVEPAALAGSTAFARVSTAGIGPPAAVEELLTSMVAQVAAAGATRLVLDTDDPARSGVTGVEVAPPMRVTNSLGRRIERLVTRVPGQVGLYSCGPTVYSYQHIGNLRTYVFADTLKRALRWRGLDVHHVINITDVGHLLADADQGEDKVEEAARKEGRPVDEITGHYTSVFWDDLRAINVISPDEWPHASAYVPQMINFAKVLEEHGYAYALPQGLYFDTAKQADYGELAGIDLSAQLETGRVEEVEGKRSLADFALWRTFVDDRERLMHWDSPWGTGAPGWHLECSVMSMSLLGDHFDIHTGGVDHRELHHVNEIAQSEGYLDDGTRWVRYWMHGEFLNLKGAKMAKSAGGILRLADLVELGVHPLAYRYLLLGSHYASQLDFSEKLTASAHVALKRLAARVSALVGSGSGSGLGLGSGFGTDDPITLVEALDAASSAGSATLRSRLLEIDAAVAEDLMMPTVIALISVWSKDPSALPPAEWEILLRAVNSLTGLSLGVLGVADFAPPLPPDVDVAWVEDRLAQREEARAAKDWSRADEMRDALAAVGVRIEDTPEGSHWSYAGPAS